MAVAAQTDEILDAASFLERLGPDPERQELIGGRVVMMTGGTVAAAMLAARLVTLLNNRLRSGCMAFGDGSLVRIDGGNVLSPDVFVQCGPFDREAHQFDAPVVVAEILSPTTETDDRNRKWRLYRRLPSLRHYLLVSQDERRLEHYAKAGDIWRYEDLAGGERLVLDALGIEVPLDEVYEGIL